MGVSEGPKPKTIPSWQFKDAATLESSEENTLQSPDENTTSNPREYLLKQATKFLEDGDIRNAPIERKRFFLGSKGLSAEEISDLLHEEQDEMEHAPEAEVMEDYGIDKEELSQHQSAKRRPSAPDQESLSALPVDPAWKPKDEPPIITYPEFLIHSKSRRP